MGVLVYFGLSLILHPVSTIRGIGGLIRSLRDLEAMITQEPVVEPIRVENAETSLVPARLVGFALVASSLAAAAIQLSTL